MKLPEAVGPFHPPQQEQRTSAATFLPGDLLVPVLVPRSFRYVTGCLQLQDVFWHLNVIRSRLSLHQHLSGYRNIPYKHHMFVNTVPSPQENNWNPISLYVQTADWGGSPAPGSNVCKNAINKYKSLKMNLREIQTGRLRPSVQGRLGQLTNPPKLTLIRSSGLRKDVFFLV